MQVTSFVLDTRGPAGARAHLVPQQTGSVNQEVPSGQHIHPRGMVYLTQSRFPCFTSPTTFLSPLEHGGAWQQDSSSGFGSSPRTWPRHRACIASRLQSPHALTCLPRQTGAIPAALPCTERPEGNKTLQGCLGLGVSPQCPQQT